jgi:hypothetical protein
MPYVLDTNYATVGDLEGLPSTSISKLAVAKFGPAVNAEKSLKRPGLSTVEARPEVTAQAPTGPIGPGPSEPASGSAPVAESWLSQHKWWLAGGTAALAILVSVILVLISRKSASAAIPPTADWRRS